jgi:hypothetical protein
MKAVSFHSNEQDLHAPSGDTAGISTLKVVPVEYATGDVALVSCWELSDEDLAAIAHDRRIYVGVLNCGHPPIKLTTQASEFGIAPNR